MAHTLSSVTIQCVPAVRQWSIIRNASEILFLNSCSLGSQSISAGAVLLCSRGSCSWARDDVAFEKRVVFVVLERGREGTVLHFAIGIEWRGAFLVSPRNVNTHLVKYTSRLLTLGLTVFTRLSPSASGAAAEQDSEIAVSCEQGQPWVMEDVAGNSGCVLLLGCWATKFHGSNAALSYLKYFRVFFSVP